MTKKYVSIALYLTPKQRDWLKKLAQKQQRSASDIIREVVQEMMEQSPTPVVAGKMNNLM